jgi:hypothetical protein
MATIITPNSVSRRAGCPNVSAQRCAARATEIAAQRISSVWTVKSGCATRRGVHILSEISPIYSILSVPYHAFVELIHGVQQQTGCTTTLSSSRRAPRTARSASGRIQWLFSSYELQPLGACEPWTARTLAPGHVIEYAEPARALTTCITLDADFAGFNSALHDSTVFLARAADLESRVHVVSRWSPM